MEENISFLKRPAEDGHADVREIIESGLAKLKEWLDLRLQRQEELLRHLDLREFPRSPENGRGGTDFQGSMCSDSKLLQVSPKSDHSIEVLTLPGSAIQGSPDSPHSRPSSELKKTVTLPEDSERVFYPAPVWSSEHVLERNATKSVSSGSNRVSKLRSSATSVRTLVSSASADGTNEWQSKLMDIFDQMDLDRSGSIDRTEFMEAFKEAGMPDMKAFDVFTSADKSENGHIDRVEWLHLVEEAATASDDEINLLIEFLDRLTELQRNRGRIYEHDRKKNPACILRHDSPYRVAWDLYLTLLLFYISLAVPFTLGFGQNKTLETIDQVADIFFCFDVILNFRTTYMDYHDDAVISDGKKIAKKYLKSWFLLDFFSSVPMELITGGLMPNLTPARLLKIGKIAKVMKLLRISKMLTVLAQSELLEKFDQKIQSRGHQTFARLVKLAAMAFIVAHWLACFGNAVDGSSLNAYLSEEASAMQKYLANFYWAMTTLSTVGYGDILPQTDGERAYAVFAMVVGGSLYGYVVGSVTSVVTDMDVGTHAYHERMELIQSWLDRHNEIPKLLRRRVRKHFKRVLACKSVMEDSAVIGELSPELRADTAYFLTNLHVRNHVMFSNVPNSALAKIVEVVHKNHANAEEFIVKVGDPGIAMYILVEGLARFDQGQRWTPLEVKSTPSRKSMRFERVSEGDSFGEEIIFGLEESYQYTVITLEDCEFHSISEDGFTNCFQNMPELRNEMLASYLQDLGALGGSIDDERSSLLVQASKTINPGLSSSPHSSNQPSQKSFNGILPDPTPVVSDV